jgi:hypothetical protein
MSEIGNSDIPNTIPRKAKPYPRLKGKDKRQIATLPIG